MFTGPYAVDAFVGGGHIDLVPNMYYGPRVLDATRVDHSPSKHPAVDIPLPPRRRTCYFGADSRNP